MRDGLRFFAVVVFGVLAFALLVMYPYYRRDPSRFSRD
jgi:hypothetical protein